MTYDLVESSRRDAMAVNVSENRVLCRVLGKWKMFVDARDISVLPYLAMDGMVDPHITSLLYRTVQPGWVCADVGACFGYHTLIMSHMVGQTGRVYAFEPHPRVFPMLKHNIEINNFCPRVRPYPNAMGDMQCNQTLAIHKRRFAGATLSEKAKASFGCLDSTTVMVGTLDSILTPNNANPDFYMIATEGYEPQVWEGMRGLLRSKRKITVLMEFIPRWYADPLKFASQILDEGFVVNRVRDDGEQEPVVEVEHFLGKFRSYLLLTR